MSPTSKESMTTTPNCDCHDVPMYWHASKTMRAGGAWRCTVKRREYDKSRDRRKGEAEREKDRLRMRAIYRAKKHKELIYRSRTYGQMPAAPVARIIREWLDKQDTFVSPGNFFHQDQKIIPFSPMNRLMHLTGMELWRIKSGKDKWISFDRADKIITAIDPQLWHTDPELKEIYQNFDFSFLDRKYPLNAS